MDYLNMPLIETLIEHYNNNKLNKYSNQKVKKKKKNMFEFMDIFIH